MTKSRRVARSSVRRAVLVTALAAFGLGAATAGPIVSAVGATVDVGGPGTDVTVTYNQGGLFNPYTPGVTDFDSYIAGNPQHSVVYPNREWFAEGDATAISVTYDLGDVRNIDKVALWNVESSAGISVLELLTSTDGQVFVAVASGLSPTLHPVATNVLTDSYGADVFAFGAVSARFVRFVGSGCITTCGIGEVAFQLSDDVSAVSEPSTVALAGLALLAGVASKRRYRAGAPARATSRL